MPAASLKVTVNFYIYRILVLGYDFVQILFRFLLLRILKALIGKDTDDGEEDGDDDAKYAGG